MAEKRNPFPQPNRIRSYVRKELIRRKRNIGNSQLSIPTPTIMPFVRFTSTKSDPQFKYRLFHLGLHGYDDVSQDFGNIFELNYGGQDVVGYGINTTNGARIPILSTQSQLTKGNPPAEGGHPVPGITSITTEHMGANEPIRTTVNWVCYNDTQLEFLRQHFLLAGGYVIAEFGHIMSNRPEVVIPFSFSDPDAAVQQLTDFVINGRGPMSDKLLRKAQGNYNMVIGRVVDQSISYESDGTIQCSTTFYSTGEALFGIHNNRLMGALKIKSGKGEEEDEEAPTIAKTIAEFFDNSGRFDQMLQEEPLKKFVIDMRGKTEKETWFPLFGGSDKPSDDESVKEKFKANDARFIPWSMFVEDVMVELFALGNKNKIPADVSLFTIINRDDQPAVGNHHLLSSTDPEVMVIVKPFMVGKAEGETPGEFSSVRREDRQIDSQQKFAIARPGANPFFVSGSGTNKDEKGLLTNGVWINTGAIKEAFHSQNTFYESIKQLLQHMNNATENYWNLDLAFDDETEQYKIYDKKCVFSDKNYPTPYVFNQGNQGELLSLAFSADFSKEAKTAILLAPKPRTQQEIQEANDVGGEVGTFNQPNLYTQALNLPLLHDDLGVSVHNARVANLPALTEAQVAKRATRVREQADARAIREEEQTEASVEVRKSRLDRFAQPLGAYIALPSEMLAKIFGSGLNNPNQINNFVAPIPTEINLSMTMQGITGLAFYDTFQVAKLPQVYARHGVFLINDIKHEVNTTTGWTTEIGGLYYFVDPLGRGQRSQDPVSPTREFDRLDESVTSEDNSSFLGDIADAFRNFRGL